MLGVSFFFKCWQYIFTHPITWSIEIITQSKFQQEVDTISIKKIYTVNGEDGYEPTTIPITVGR